MKGSMKGNTNRFDLGCAVSTGGRKRNGTDINDDAEEDRPSQRCRISPPSGLLVGDSVRVGGSPEINPSSGSQSIAFHPVPFTVLDPFGDHSPGTDELPSSPELDIVGVSDDVSFTNSQSSAYYSGKVSPSVHGCDSLGARNTPGSGSIIQLDCSTAELENPTGKQSFAWLLDSSDSD
jgi:hypothetical protein